MKWQSVNLYLFTSEHVRELRTSCDRSSGGPGFQKKAIFGRTGGHETGVRASLDHSMILYHTQLL